MTEMIRVSDLRERIEGIVDELYKMGSKAKLFDYKLLPTVPAIELEKIREVVERLKFPKDKEFNAEYNDIYNQALSDLLKVIGEKQ